VSTRAYRVGEFIGGLLAVIVAGTFCGGVLAAIALALWSVLR